MSQNRFYRITILIFSLLFLNIVILQAGIHAPKGEENKIKLKIKGKEEPTMNLMKTVSIIKAWERSLKWEIQSELVFILDP